MSRVLVVDDDPALRRALSINLRAHGYEVVLAEDGAGALRATAREHPDVVLLDLGLPDMDGGQVLAGIRGWSGVPVIVLSARRVSEDKVDALDAGADDYVTKPFGMDELLARLRAAVRRGRPADGTPAAVVDAGAFVVDLGARRVRRAGADVRLTPTEWSLLEALARRPGTVVGQRELLREVWGPAYEDESHYLRVYMAQLRRKLEPEPGSPRHLLTEPGRGYRLEVGAAGDGQSRERTG